MFSAREMNLGARTVASPIRLHNVADIDPWIKWGHVFILEVGGGRGRWQRRGGGC